MSEKLEQIARLYEDVAGGPLQPWQRDVVLAVIDRQIERVVIR